MNLESDRRWDQLADELEFTQLGELRRQAEGWRSGLTGLAALLSVLVVLKGRDDLAGLPATARVVASGLLALAFLLLVAGSVLATRAAHGRMGDRSQLLGGQALRRWTVRELDRLAGALRRAAFCCCAGILLAAAAVAVAWSTTESAPDHLVRVGTTTGERCGALLPSGPDTVVLGVGATDGGATERVVLPGPTVTSVTPVSSCPAQG
ncbi:hypothetical protein AB0G32_20290 [Streptomyces sp. NPDC023723]|uniref:hypothetical protein n=1 Tax=Streptomyces sp. NPDC023723 TaxID=3154323 RepID=UPI0033E7425C